MANKVINLFCILLIISAASSESLDGEFSFQCFEEDVKGKNLMPTILSKLSYILLKNTFM